MPVMPEGLPDLAFDPVTLYCSFTDFLGDGYTDSRVFKISCNSVEAEMLAVNRNFSVENRSKLGSIQ